MITFLVIFGLIATVICCHQFGKIERGEYESDVDWKNLDRLSVKQKNFYALIKQALIDRKYKIKGGEMVGHYQKDYYMDLNLPNDITVRMYYKQSVPFGAEMYYLFADRNWNVKGSPIPHEINSIELFHLVNNHLEERRNPSTKIEQAQKEDELLRLVTHGG